MEEFIFIDEKTSEEYICNKVTIDGYDYYFNTKQEDSIYGWVLYASSRPYYMYGQGLWNKYRWEEGAKIQSTLSHTVSVRRILATNNPEIQIRTSFKKINKNTKTFNQ